MAGSMWVERPDFPGSEEGAVVEQVKVYGVTVTKAPERWVPTLAGPVSYQWVLESSQAVVVGSHVALACRWVWRRQDAGGGQ